jgi:hypothetical protein
MADTSPTSTANLVPVSAQEPFRLRAFAAPGVDRKAVGRQASADQASSLDAATEKRRAEFQRFDAAALDNILDRQADERIFRRRDDRSFAVEDRVNTLAEDQAAKLRSELKVGENQAIADGVIEQNRTDAAFQADVLARRLDRQKRDQAFYQAQALALQAADRSIESAQFDPEAPRGSIVDVRI